MTDPRVDAALRAAWEYTYPAKEGCSLESYREHNPEVVENMVAAVIAALAAADVAAWRPIESAPMDGAYVDLWVINSDGEGRRITDAYFGPIPHTCGEYGQYCDSCPEKGNFWIDGIFGHEIHGEITHWQPLPSPPTTPESKS